MFIDTHAHLDAEEFHDDRAAVIERARAAGVEAMVCPAISAASSAAGVELARLNAGIYAAVGIQPNYVGEAQAGDWERVVALAGEPRVVALGETGLDRHWDFAPFALQQEYFERHLRLAQERGLPVVIHCREAEADVLAMLRAARERGPLAGVMHSFSGDEDFARVCLELGLYLSFSGSMSYTNKKFAGQRAAAKAAPSNRLLLETDSPYLVPHPLRGKEKRNEPARIGLTAAALAELRGVTVEELARETTTNARRLFGLREA